MSYVHPNLAGTVLEHVPVRDSFASDKGREVAAYRMHRYGVPWEATPNEPAIREVLAYIEADPTRWDQRQWATALECGTSHCMAGWAYVLNSGKSWKPWDIDRNNEANIVAAAAYLGLGAWQAADIFFFTDLGVNGTYGYEPTFPELCAKVAAVTGIVHKPLELLAPLESTGESA